MIDLDVSYLKLNQLLGTNITIFITEILLTPILDIWFNLAKLIFNFAQFD